MHPTRRCNLRCLHCYSDSGPEQRDGLDPSRLREALEDAATEGFTVAGFSGGEPLLYESLEATLDHAHSCGLITTVTSNGMLLTERRLEGLAGRVDLLAISLDGVPESHNQMRAHPRAFGTMAKRLTTLRRSDIPFGFIFTLTQHNVNELDWVAGFAEEQGAGLLQIHPLEDAGRAKTRLRGERPDEVESLFAQLESLRLRAKAEGRMAIQIDISDSRRLAESPERVFAGEPASPEGTFGRLISPLVIEADGTVVPLQYGFPRRFALGNINDSPLRRLAEDWRENGLLELRELCAEVHAKLTDPGNPRFVNWYEAVSEHAEAL